MSRVITCATHKGGEGKTTLSILLAEYLTIVKKKKVLLIDMDPQANLSSRYIEMEVDPSRKDGMRPPIHPESEEGQEERSSIADLFYGNPVYPYPTPFKNLEIIPGSHHLEEVRSSFKNSSKQEVAKALNMFLSLDELRAEYDYVVIDTPPSKCPLTRAAIKSTEFMIIPAKMEKFSLDGIYGMLQLYTQEQFERGENNHIHLLGIVPNMIKDVNLHKQNRESLSAHKVISKYMSTVQLKNRVKYPEVLSEDANPKSVFEFPKTSAIREEAQGLCEDFYKKIQSLTKQNQEEVV